MNHHNGVNNASSCSPYDNLHMYQTLQTASSVILLKWSPEQFVQDYDAFLQKYLVITSSFQNIVDGKLNKKRRFQ